MKVKISKCDCVHCTPETTCDRCLERETSTRIDEEVPKELKIIVQGEEYTAKEEDFIKAGGKTKTYPFFSAETEEKFIGRISDLENNGFIDNNLEDTKNQTMRSSSDYDPEKREIGKDGVVSTDIPMNEFVLTESKEGKYTKEPYRKWNPEDYGFTSPFTGVWYYKNLELRTLKRNYWLLRKKVKNERGNSEMLIKWRVQILPEDKDFADVMFGKGLK